MAKRLPGRDGANPFFPTEPLSPHPHGYYSNIPGPFDVGASFARAFEDMRSRRRGSPINLKAKWVSTQVWAFQHRGMTFPECGCGNFVAAEARHYQGLWQCGACGMFQPPLASREAGARTVTVTRSSVRVLARLPSGRLLLEFERGEPGTTSCAKTFTLGNEGLTFIAAVTEIGNE